MGTETGVWYSGNSADLTGVWYSGNSVVYTEWRADSVPSGEHKAKTLDDIIAEEAKRIRT